MVVGNLGKIFGDELAELVSFFVKKLTAASGRFNDEHPNRP
jgi:hypothetical protein